MKHRTLIILALILSLLMIPVDVKASTIVVDRAANTQKLGSSQRSFSTGLADIINALPQGHHDNFAGTQSPFFCRAEGWAADPDDRTTPLQIRIFSDGVEVAQTVADTFRPDLADAGVCLEGNCSFSLNLWGLITPDVNHMISVEAQNAQTGEWGALYDTPKTLNCFMPQAETFIVNSTADGGDANPGDSVCETFNPGECTLRAAIREANASQGMDTISFNIPGTGPHTISPSYGFDFISDPVIIDGTTQPGFAGTPIIELDGSNAGSDADGLVIFAGSSTIRGLVINRFSLTGIDIDVNGGNIIQGNYIGTDPTGTIALGNGVNGIAISQGSAGNIIGGTEAGARNLISGNDCAAVVINSTGSTGNLVQGNYIGTDVTGTFAMGNGCEGVFIGTGAGNNVIGGAMAGAGNLISGNATNGITIIDIESTGNLIQGNYIGTDVTGQSGLGNADDGVLLLAPNNTIGGTTPEARNIISGNQEQGIRMQGSEASGNNIQGNFIGLDSTGTVALGNGTECCHSGIVMHLGASNNTIGGSTPGAGNVISGNTAEGITITDAGTSGNIVAGNFIGTDVTGMQEVGNSFDGVVLFAGASDNLIGGTQIGAGNVSSGNGANGIAIYDVGTKGNVVQGNFIGTDVTATLSLGNAGHGVAIATGASDNLIGGTITGAGNTITSNNASGVLVASDSSTGNAILTNSIYSNGNPGIDLGEDDVTPNDLFDADSGPNTLQNFPLLNPAKGTGKGILIQGALLSTRNTTFRLEFFTNDVCDPSGYGEGQTYLGSVNIKTNSTGHVNFKITLPTALPSGRYVTATATDPANNTSEFSQCVAVSP